MGRGVVAFDIGKGQIKVLNFTPTIRGPKVFDIKSFPLNKDWEKEASDVIREVLSEKKRVNTVVASILPGYLFFIRNYYFPFSNMRKIRKALPFEIEGDIPLPGEDVVIDCLFSRRREKGVEVIAFILPRSTLEEYLSIFPKDFMPDVLIPDLAVLPLLIPHNSRNCAFFEIESDKVTIGVVSSGRLVAGRSISLSPEVVSEVREEIVSTLKGWREEWIEVNKGYFAGDGVKGFDLEDITSKLEMELIPFPIPKSLKGYEDSESFLPLFGLAQSFAGLELNLLRGEKEEEERETLKKRLVASIIGISILVIMGLSDISLKYFFLKREYEELKREGVEIFKGFMPEVKRIVNESAQLKQALEEGRRELELLTTGRFIGFKPSGFIEMLYKEASNKGVSLIEVGIDGDEIVFEGETSNADSIGPFMTEVKGHKGVVEAVIQKMEPGVKTTRFKGRFVIKD